MPTNLPDKAARIRRERHHFGRTLASMITAIVYVVLLAWNVATFDLGSISSAFKANRHIGEYNPMEPSNRPAGNSIWPGRFAQR